MNPYGIRPPIPAPLHKPLGDWTTANEAARDEYHRVPFAACTWTECDDLAEIPGAPCPVHLKARAKNRAAAHRRAAERKP